METRIRCLCLLAIVAMVVGCGPKQTDSPSTATQVDGSKYLLAAEPEGVRNVKQFLQDAQDGDEVVVVGRVGGEVDPWVDGLAAFNVADLSLKACDDCEGGECPTPWDYCCEADLATGRTLVQVVDADGEIVTHGAKKLLDIKELQTVVIQGCARRDDAGNVTLLASGIFVRP